MAWPAAGGGPRAAGEGGGLWPVRGIPAGYGRSGCVVILTLVLLFVGVSFTQLLHWSHRGAAGLSLGPCRAQPRLVQRTVKHHVR